MKRPPADVAHYAHLTPTTRDVMDVATCGLCKAGDPHHHHVGDPLFLHARCHIGADVQAAYWDGCIYLFCGTCSKFVGKFSVASLPIRGQQ